MSRRDEKGTQTGTELDPKLARPRMKEGLVPGSTGIFLKIETGEDAGATIDLSPGGCYLIGRSGADIALEDTKVSRRHAEISLLGPEAYFLRDLASTNGTFLEGRRVTDRVPLRSESRIRVGDTVLTFSVVEGSIRMGAGRK